MKIKNIYLIRHGETDWNRQHRFQGKTDIPLNQLGREQAEQLIPKMSLLSIDAVYASPLLRASETALIAVKDLKLTIQKDERLMETNVGDAEGLTFEEMQAKFGDNGIERWRSYEERDLDFSYPNGESKRQMMFRVRSAILEISQNTPGNNIAVFAHGMVMRSLTFAFQQGIPWDIQVFSNGSVHHFVWNEDRSDYLQYKGKIKD